MLVWFTMVYIAIVLPFRAAGFRYGLGDDCGHLGLSWKDIVADCIFLCDMVFSSKTAFYKQSGGGHLILIDDVESIKRNYVSSVGFLCDVLGILPLREIYCLTERTAAMLSPQRVGPFRPAIVHRKFIGLFKILRMVKLFRLHHFRQIPRPLTLNRAVNPVSSTPTCCAWGYGGTVCTKQAPHWEIFAMIDIDLLGVRTTTWRAWAGTIDPHRLAYASMDPHRLAYASCRLSAPADHHHHQQQLASWSSPSSPSADRLIITRHMWRFVNAKFPDKTRVLNLVKLLAMLLFAGPKPCPLHTALLPCDLDILSCSQCAPHVLRSCTRSGHSPHHTLHQDPVTRFLPFKHHFRACKVPPPHTAPPHLLEMHFPPPHTQRPHVRSRGAGHLLACTWYFVGNLSPDSWILRSGELMKSDHWFSHYVTSFYFVYATMTTVGYGDIKGVTVPERVFCVMAMVVGGFLFGILIGSVPHIMERRSQGGNRYSELEVHLKEYLSEKKTPPGLKSRIMQYMEYRYPDRRMFPDKKIRDGLPRVLRRDLAVALNQDLVNMCYVLSRAESTALRDVCDQLVQEFAENGLVILREGQPLKGIYFVRAGQVELTRCGGFVKRLLPGDIFGENALMGQFQGDVNLYTATAVAPTELCFLPLEKFEMIVVNHPNMVFTTDPSQWTKARVSWAQGCCCSRSSCMLLFFSSLRGYASIPHLSCAPYS